MEIMIKIPEEKIPQKQGILEIGLHFVDGQLCDASGYEFRMVPESEEPEIIRCKMSNLISREDAIELFYDSISGVPFNSVRYVGEYADKMMAKIRNLPSAEKE